MNAPALPQEECRPLYLRIARLAVGDLEELGKRIRCGEVRRSAGVNDAQFDGLNLCILRDVQRRGRVYVSNGTDHGKFALRAGMVNHRTTLADVEAVVDEVLQVGRELSPGAQS